MRSNASFPQAMPPFSVTSFFEAFLMVFFLCMVFIVFICVLMWGLVAFFRYCVFGFRQQLYFFAHRIIDGACHQDGKNKMSFHDNHGMGADFPDVDWRNMTAVA